MKTQLDKWDNLVVFYCKDHFKKIYAPLDEIEGLRKILEERNAYEGIDNHTIYEYLMQNIVEPFIVPNEPNFIRFIINNASPQESWKVGYRGSERPFGQPRAIPYDYWEAMIYAMMSLISLCEVRYLTGLKGKPDFELFEECIKDVNVAERNTI